MIVVLIGILCFSIGVIVGNMFQTMAFESQDWMVLKWSKDSLGFRPMPPGSRISKGDRVAMSLEIDSSKFPEEGVALE